ncbi:D-amino acid dehydrogenase [Seminavis robusta]|uniref:D-amino acid dehydrogenase n=1 Tax=Seminavis robusta TaxID=568900 RepID=A0A9N8HP96_9STRA|nr:D-amino acid dehydrogenase [Seminavis robusta]|eukprot:Sro883_g215510.1 D-amino acid dehydrogenase (536) ;mRNA; f:33301-35042
MSMTSMIGKAVGLGSVGLGASAIFRYQQILQREEQLPSKAHPLLPGVANSNSSNGKKNAIVIGGGVVGVTAAYKLALAGHSVALLEPRSEPGQECSACAAGGMQRSNPTVDKDTWMAVLQSIAPWKSGSGDFKFFHIDWWKTLSDPLFARWIFTFTRTSLFPGPEQQDKQQQMLAFTKYAVEDMVKMMKDPNDNMAVKSGFNPRGSLNLSYQQPAQTKTVSHPSGSIKRAVEPVQELINDQITEQEPSIIFQTVKPTTAKFQYESCAASSERFTQELAQRCKDLGVTFLYDTTVKAIQVDQKDNSTNNNNNNKPRISQLVTNRGVVHVPENTDVVVAAGAWVPHVLALLDLYAPVYPLKGYAMSVSAKDALASNKLLKEQDLPSRIVSDKYMFTSRLGDEIRITSIGEFSGWSTVPNQSVEAEVRREAVRQFPQLQSLIEKAPTRCGHRPYVSDGILLLGRADTHENLLVSCGPGSNGWKLAMGSGEVIQRLVSGDTEEQISQDLGFDVRTFSPGNGRVSKAPLFAKLCRARWDL